MRISMENNALNLAHDYFLEISQQQQQSAATNPKHLMVNFSIPQNIITNELKS